MRVVIVVIMRARVIVVIMRARSAGARAAPFGVVFEATSVAAGAVFNVADALFAVLLRHASGRMLVAPITGVAIERVGMAGLARAGRVVTIEPEVLLMPERGGRPCLDGVTAPALGADLTMESIRGPLIGVAVRATVKSLRRNHRMVKRRGCPRLEPMATSA
jgi:hypothetical protein